MEIKTVAEEGILMPDRQHEWDAGADLKAASDPTIGPGEFAMVPTGVRCAIPEGYVGLLFARSSQCKRGLMMANGVGVIDSGYTGEIKVPLLNMAKHPNELAVGERIAQLVVLPCMLPTFEQVEELPETERGEGGFGSTGSGVVAENATAEEPKFLDFDGVPINPGDVVYTANIDGMPLGSPKKVVCTVNCGGELTFEYTFDGDTERYEGYPGSHTHREPDSWEKLKSDMANLAESPCVYLNHGDEPEACILCDAWDVCDHNDGMAFALKDILARAKRLAGVADE